MRTDNPFVRPRALALICAGLLLMMLAGIALAEDAAEPTTVPGMPAGSSWKFDFDAGWGFFGFGNSLYANPRDEPSGNLGDDWMEGYIKPGLGGTHTLGGGAEIYGKASGVGVRTYNAPPDLVGEESSSFGVEDLYIGWRSGKSLGIGENALDVSVGRMQYKLGHGMLLYDGASDGGSRGGYWTGARKAFEFAGVARFKAHGSTLETFYLDKDELPESDSATTLWGVNYEYAIGEDTTLGATYMAFSANGLQAQRDGLDVYNARVFTAPIPSMKALSFEVEYAMEDNGDLLDSTAWNALVAWQFEGKWKPKLSYRYAIFEGDDPDTTANEAFDGLLTGFNDWGTWWQGEIVGEYFASNSNLISNQVRVHLAPSESIGTGFIFYDYHFDHPETVGPGVTSDNVAGELDWYMDWSLNDNFLVSFVAAYADPGRGIEQAFDRTEKFYYGMIYVAYSY